MSTPDPTNPRRRSVFLSYASEDRQAAQVLRDALPAYGLDVWYDESELTGGDAWDQKIRRQIRECDFFLPLISTHTEARHEGYFRREWRLAVERTLDMADDHPFLLPVVIDDTGQTGARVPEKFLAVQWSRLPGGKPTAAFEAVCRRLAAGDVRSISPGKVASVSVGSVGSPAIPASFPEFPHEEPGQRTRFVFRVVGWSLQWLWAGFRRVPKWGRVLVYVWFGIVAVKSCSQSGRVDRVENSARVPPAAERKLKEGDEGNPSRAAGRDMKKLGAAIAAAVSKQIPDKVPLSGTTGQNRPLLVIPFTASPTDQAARKLAETAFAKVYGRVIVSHPGEVGLAFEPLPSMDPGAAIERGRASHSDYVLYGGIEKRDGTDNVAVEILSVDDGSVVWSQSYPAATADVAKIAADADSKLPDLGSG